MTISERARLRQRPRLGRPARLAIVFLSGAVVFTGCNSATESPPPNGPSPAPGTPGMADLTPVPTTGGGASPTAGLPQQTDTEWGRIWDDIPPSFPRYPGSIPTETGVGPASARLALPVEPLEASRFIQAALETAGYSTEALSGPLEDGSYVIDSVGVTADCRVETAIAPLGNLTVMTVMYGAGCPFR